MSKSNPTSKRQKKKIVQEGLKGLKNKPGWDVEAFRSAPPEENLRDFDQQLRGNRVFSQSDDCEDCLQLRQKSGDATALCDDHLAAAMGFGD
jgi:hypothetical protein